MPVTITVTDHLTDKMSPEPIVSVSVDLAEMGTGHEDSTYKWASILERKRKLPLVFVAPYHCLM